MYLPRSSKFYAYQTLNKLHKKSRHYPILREIYICLEKYVTFLGQSKIMYFLTIKIKTVSYFDFNVILSL